MKDPPGWGEPEKPEEVAQRAPGPDRPGQGEPATQKVPAAVQKLYNSLTSTPHPITQGRKRRGRHGRKIIRRPPFAGRDTVNTHSKPS